MKKNLLLLLALVVSLSVFSQYKAMNVEPAKNPAPKSVAALAPNFTTTDINGNTYTLYDYLNAGKTVIIDMMATWCSPCWSFHTNGALEEVYNTYGPNGTNEMMVFMMEADPTTAASTLTTSTLGDWTAGTPQPICNDDNIAALYNLQYYPTILMICPTGDYYEVGQGITAYYTAAEYYAFAQQCPSATDVPVCDFSFNASAAMGATVNFTDESWALPTSWSWTFDQGTPTSSTDQNPTCVWNTAGTFDITLIASNANGAGTAVTKQITIIDPASTNNLNVTFEECVTNWTGDFAPYQWTTVDVDGGAVWGDFSDVGVTGPMAFNVYDHTEAMATVGNGLAPHGGNKAGMVMNTVTASAPNNDWFISPQITLGTGSSISMWAASLSTDWGAEEFYIAVSTTDNLPASFTNVSPLNTPGEAYTNYTADLSAYDNTQIYVGIHCVSNDHFVLFVDDIQITTLIGIDENNATSVRVFPNPSNGTINVENAQGSSIMIYNLIGEVVASQAKANKFESFDLSALSNGTYLVKVISEAQVSTQKVVINK